MGPSYVTSPGEQHFSKVQRGKQALGSSMFGIFEGSVRVLNANKGLCKFLCRMAGGEACLDEPGVRVEGRI